MNTVIQIDEPKGKLTSEQWVELGTRVFVGGVEMQGVRTVTMPQYEPGVAAKVTLEVYVSEIRTRVIKGKGRVRK